MKKILIFILFATMILADKSLAQSHLVATLDHDGTVSVFTGQDAFINAHESAVDGDVITLSSGAFKSSIITKAISLYGAGVLPYYNSTQLIDSLHIEIPSTTTKELRIEGIRCPYTNTYDLNNATFMKCTFENGVVYRGNKQGCTFINCRFSVLSNQTGLAILANSVIISSISSVQNDTTSYICNNCFARFVPTDLMYNSLFTNCILYNKVDDTYNNENYVELDRSNSLISCLTFLETISLDKITIDTSSHYYIDRWVFPDIFKNTFDFWDQNIDKNLELTDAAKTTYLGNDGTEVGIYGGAMPYNPTPSIPRIKSLRMDAKPSKGILKADVEVE